MIDDTGPWVAADAGDEMGVDYLSNLPKMIALASSGGIHCVGDVSCNNRCKRCAAGPLRVLLSPCGHVSLCEACAPSTNACPYCFKAIEKRERVEGRGL